MASRAGRRSPLQDIDRELLHTILGGRYGETRPAPSVLSREDVVAGIDLVSFYIAQLVHSISIGPLVPTRIVLGGRMIKPAVIQAVREKILEWNNNYPLRPGLTPETIGKHIVGSQAEDSEKGSIELGGALAIAKARAALPLTWGGTRVPLPLNLPYERRVSGKDRGRSGASSEEIIGGAKLINLNDFRKKNKKPER